MKAERAAVYARVSTAEQVEGTSLHSQVAQAEVYVASKGWSLAGRFVDEGVSGAKARRPALDSLMTKIKAGEVDVVVVTKLDRIGRSMRHLAALLGDLDDLGVRLVSVSEAFDSTTAAGRLQRNMLASFAEFEREQIRDRLHTGRDAVLRRGKYVATNAPFGYRIETDGNERRLVIDPVEAETMRLAIDLFVNQRMTTGQVAAELNARGMKPRRAPRWYGHALRIMLRNAHHISGTWTWRHPRKGLNEAPIQLEIPPLVDNKTHERLRARFAATSKSQTHGSDRYLLSGRIRTPHGTVMYGLKNPAQRATAGRFAPSTSRRRSGGRCARSWSTPYVCSLWPVCTWHVRRPAWTMVKTSRRSTGESPDWKRQPGRRCRACWPRGSTQQ